jgi:ubiquitin carboxyl-terminal hydrolase 16
MPEKSLTVATYAAGASLAAITLIYVFAPTYFLDNEPAASNNPLAALTGRKKGVVGLTNAANDCFINSILQALAGLSDLRIYLIRETHRRNIDDVWVYARAVPNQESSDDDDDQHRNHDIPNTNGPPRSPHRPMPEWKVEGLQRGIVTKGLKEILDQLNERPLHRKTVSAVPFVRVLETAFRQRISRQQQDAQEFLQVVAERLCDEYHAGQRARRHAKKAALKAAEGAPLSPELPAASGSVYGGTFSGTDAAARPQSVAKPAAFTDEESQEDGFPMEGKFVSQVECQTCGFKPRPAEQMFCTLTLNVPQAASTSLNDCFDGMFKTEYIDEFKCEKCRLLHAVDAYEAEAIMASSSAAQDRAREAVGKLQIAIATDPEKQPDGVILPDVRFAPKRKIARHTRIVSFPKILAIHLSRSIYDSSQMSQKNSAKVAFPERLPVGGLLQQRKYKLLAVVCHKGSHHSGHYESFRRQNLAPPFSNPHTFQPSGVYSRSASPVPSAQLPSAQQGSRQGSPLSSVTDIASSPRGSETTLPMRSRVRGSPTPGDDMASSSRRGPTSAPREAAKERDSETSSLRSMTRSTLSRIAPSSRSGSRSGSRAATPVRAAKLKPGEDDEIPRQPAVESKPRRKKYHDRWWRISDEKAKEASTKEVLGMQREVYLLFYELERET